MQRQSPILVAYTASKAAVTSVAKNLSKSLAPDGILVDAVCPGSIVTASFTENLRETFAAEGLDPTDPYDVMKWIEQTFHQPADLGRAGLPDEVASLTAYLVSRRNGYVHRGLYQRRRRVRLRLITSWCGWPATGDKREVMTQFPVQAKVICQAHDWLHDSWPRGQRHHYPWVTYPA